MHPKNTIPCPICGESFIPKYKTQKYCSNPCRYVGKRKKPDAVCVQCGTIFASRSDSSGRFCSRKCVADYRRYEEQSGQCQKCGETFIYKGHDVVRGRTYCSRQCASTDASGRIESHGYILIRTDGGYVKEHRLVMEHVLGRTLSDDEVVHHINGVRNDNRPENLQVMTQSEHIALHMKQNHPTQKLSDEDVREIRRLYIPRHPQLNQYRLAQRYGVSRQTIGDIVTGRKRSS